MQLRNFLIILTVVLLVTLATLVWFYPGNEDFRSDNPFWNGTKNLGSFTRVLPQASLSNLPATPQGSTLILIPYLPFTSVELELLNSFVTNGGTLILADDYGYGNQILEYLGLGARFTGQVLLDPFSNYRNRRFPRISRIIHSPVTNDVNSLIFDHGTSLSNIEAADTFALSSSFSFLDLNGNEEQDGDEPTGPFPVIAQCSLGDGKTILVSDPSIFINSMQALEDNYTFIQNIDDITTIDFLFDQSHLPGSELRDAKNWLVDVRKSLISPVGTASLVILAVLIILMPVWFKRQRGVISG